MTAVAGLDDVAACRRDMAELDRLQETLENARGLIVSRLELAAGALLDGDEQAAKKLHCTKCRWVFCAFSETSQRVQFRTACRWCEWSEYHDVEASAIDAEIQRLDAEGAGK